MLRVCGVDFFNSDSISYGVRNRTPSKLLMQNPELDVIPNDSEFREDDAELISSRSCSNLTEFLISFGVVTLIQYANLLPFGAVHRVPHRLISEVYYFFIYFVSRLPW